MTWSKLNGYLKSCVYCMFGGLLEFAVSVICLSKNRYHDFSKRLFSFLLTKKIKMDL